MTTVLNRYDFKNLDNKMRERQLLYPLDILLVGSTGSGKSSSINSFFGKNVCNVGYGVDPETMDIQPYYFNQNIRLWDSPGLGDSYYADINHSKRIIDTLNEVVSIDGNTNYTDFLIDMVLLVLEAGLRDMGTATYLLKEIILSNIEKERVVIAINQADFAMKGENFINNKPNSILTNFLKEKELSIKRRLKENFGFEFPTVFYSAKTGYNLEKVFDVIIENVPKKRRMIRR